MTKPVVYNGSEWVEWSSGDGTVNGISGDVKIRVEGNGTISNNGDTITIHIANPFPSVTIGDLTNYGINQDGYDQLAAALNSLFSGGAFASSFDISALIAALNRGTTDPAAVVNQTVFDQIIQPGTVINNINQDISTPTFINTNYIGVVNTPVQGYTGSINNILNLIIDNSNDADNPVSFSADIINVDGTPIVDYVNPMTTLGDIIYADASGDPARLAGNTTGTVKFLRSVGSGGLAAAPTWSALTSSDITTALGYTPYGSSTLGPTSGGTGLTSYNIGDILYASASNTLSTLAGNGTATQKFLAMTSNTPSWVEVSATGIATDPLWDALGDIVYGDGANSGAKLAGNTTTTRKFLRQVGNGTVSAAPAWDTLTSGDVTAALGYTPIEAGNGTVPSTGIILGETDSNTNLTGAGYTLHHTRGFYLHPPEITFSALANQMPTARMRCGTGYDSGSDKIIVAGTYNASSGATLISADLYDVGAGTWSAAANMPTKRGYNSIAIFNGKAYSCGGFTDGTGYISRLDVYDFGADTWTNKTSLPEARGLGGAFYMNVGGTDYIYYVGGYTGSNYRSTIYRYNISGNSWSAALTETLTATRAGFGGVLLNGYYYIFGGASSTGSIDSAEVYDVANGTIYPLPSLPSILSVATAVADPNGLIWIFGYDSLNKLCFVFDPDTLKYEPVILTSYTAHRSLWNTLVTDGTDIFMLGGSISSSDTPTTTSSLLTISTRPLLYTYEKS